MNVIALQIHGEKITSKLKYYSFVNKFFKNSKFHPLSFLLNIWFNSGKEGKHEFIVTSYMPGICA